MEESDCSDPDSEASDYSIQSSSENEGSRPYNPTFLIPVEQALKNLNNGNISGTNNQSTKGTNTKERDFFCIEDTFSTKDLKVYVEGLGELSFPLEEDSVEKMIKLSTKAKLGIGKESLLDTGVRNTQSIPASKLKIEILSSSLDDLLKRIGFGLTIGKDSQLILHLHNLQIYGPGQFCNELADSEKVQNMFTTLVIILPYPHEGGELIIKHNNEKHMSFGSKNPDVVKCVAFYSDCTHEIKEVTCGYRVAITYTVLEISDSLDVAVENCFMSWRQRKLVFALNHSYSQKSLHWNLLKGSDQPRVNALLAVARKQGRIPCLALTSHHEVYKKDCYYFYPPLVTKKITANFMIDENNTDLTCRISEYESKDGFIQRDGEFFCLKAKQLYKPGNKSDKQEYRYRRACLVLWSSKWVLSHGFQEALGELHHLTKQNGMQKVLIEKLNEAKKDFFFVDFKIWREPNIVYMLLDIVIYVNNDEVAKFILGNLCKETLKEDRIDLFIQLDKMFSDQTWCDIVKAWKRGGYAAGWFSALDNAHTFVNQYLELVGAQYKSVVVDTLLEEGVKKSIESSEKEQRWIGKYVYSRKSKKCIETMAMYMKICSLTGKKSLEESLTNHVSSSYPAVSLGELYIKLMDHLQPENLISFEIIRDLAVKGIEARLTELKKDSGWAFPVEVACDCKTCLQVVTFFFSKTKQSLALKVSTFKEHEHLFKIFFTGLNMNYSQPCKMLSDNVGNNYKITFEKLPQLLEDRKMLNDDLVKLKEKIGDVNSLVFVDVEVENEDDCNAHSSLDFSSIEITEDVNTDLQDGMVDDEGQFPPMEEVYIKSEVTEYDDENQCEEIPKKRKRKSTKNTAYLYGKK